MTINFAIAAARTVIFLKNWSLAVGYQWTDNVVIEMSHCYNRGQKDTALGITHSGPE